MTPRLPDLLAAPEMHVAEFAALVANVPYERKGIPNSEMFFLWLCAKAAPPRRILESGRARGQSTLMLARCFPDAEIISIESNASSPDVEVAAERLRSQPNVRLLFGDATLLLPALAMEGDVALIDGPKGFRGVRLALALLASGKLPLVFVHDIGPKTAERRFFNKHLPSSRYSDEPDVVRHSHVLDDEEGMGIPSPHRFGAVGGGFGYGYGLACLRRDAAISYRLLRIRAALAGTFERLSR